MSDLNAQAQNAGSSSQGWNLGGAGLGLGDALNPQAAGAALTDVQVEQWVIKNAPALLPYLEVPELKATIRSSILSGWSKDQFTTEIQGTRWFKDAVGGSTSAVLSGGGGGRSGGGGGGVNPQTAIDNIETAKNLVINKASTYGIPVTDAQATYIATYGVNHSFNEGQFNDSILDLVNNIQGGVSGTSATGTLTVDKNQMRNLAHSYMTDLSDQTLDQYAMAIERGEMDINGVQEILMRQSTARFNWMGDLIQAGVKPLDYFAPTRDAIAKTLELPTESVNLMDSKWSNMIELADPQSGKIRPATIAEAIRAAKKDPGWANTQNAQDLAATWTNALPQVFGSN